MIGILILHLMSKYEISWYCMRHGTPKAYSYADLIIQSALMENTGQESVSQVPTLRISKLAASKQKVCESSRL